MKDWNGLIIVYTDYSMIELLLEEISIMYINPIMRDAAKVTI
jgi:hypothetical protein